MRRIMKQESLDNLDMVSDKEDYRIKLMNSPESIKKRSETKKATTRRRNQLAKELKYLLSLPFNSDYANEIDKITKMSDMEKSNDGMTVQDKILYSLLVRAMNGDVKAFEVIRDSIGEKVPEVIETKVKTEGQSTMDLFLQAKKDAEINKEDKKDGDD